MMMTPDINVAVIDFKGIPGKELVTENEDGSYTILINARLSYEGQLKAYEHAMKHINSNDFQKEDVQKIEAVAHNTEQTIIKEELSAFHKRILKEIQESRKRIQEELRKIDERNSWIAENVPSFFDQMEWNWLENQRLGDF